jgi:hypothetical protein
VDVGAQHMRAWRTLTDVGAQHMRAWRTLTVLALALAMPAMTASSAASVAGRDGYAGASPPPADASLEVVVTGLPGRVAVMQLTEALEILGYKVHTIAHMVQYPDRDLQFDLWAGAYSDKCASIHNASFMRSAVTDYGITATVGFPAALCWEALVQASPHAKVIHFEASSSEAWWHDAYRTYLKVFNMPVRPSEWYRLPLWIAVRIPGFATEAAPILEFYYKTMSCLAGVDTVGQDDGFPLDYRDSLIQRYERNNAKARSLPKTRLLVHDHADGWPKLCAFLGKPIPTTLYPAAPGALAWVYQSGFKVFEWGILGSVLGWGTLVCVFVFAFIMYMTLLEMRYLLNASAKMEYLGFRWNHVEPDSEARPEALSRGVSARQGGASSTVAGAPQGPVIQVEVGSRRLGLRGGFRVPD